MLVGERGNTKFDFRNDLAVNRCRSGIPKMTWHEMAAWKVSLSLKLRHRPNQKASRKAPHGDVRFLWFSTVVSHSKEI